MTNECCKVRVPRERNKLFKEGQFFTRTSREDLFQLRNSILLIWLKAGCAEGNSWALGHQGPGTASPLTLQREWSQPSQKPGWCHCEEHFRQMVPFLSLPVMASGTMMLIFR